MRFIGLLIGVLSGLVALVGLVQISQATLGASLIAFACWLAILFRIAQAAAHHDDMIASLKTLRDEELKQMREALQSLQR
jgi:cobalamin biosynthesis protein CobD/CbiB